MAIIIFVVFNLNIIKNINAFYYISDFIIKYILVFFSPVFNVYFDKLLKNLVVKIFISISLKYINNDLIIVFITFNNF